MPEGSEVVQIKCETTIKASFDVIHDNAIDFSIRCKWDTVLFDFRTYELSDDKSY